MRKAQSDVMHDLNCCSATSALVGTCKAPWQLQLIWFWCSFYQSIVSQVSSQTFVVSICIALSCGQHTFKSWTLLCKNLISRFRAFAQGPFSLIITNYERDLYFDVLRKQNKSLASHFHHYRPSIFKMERQNVFLSYFKIPITCSFPQDTAAWSGRTYNGWAVIPV